MRGAVSAAAIVPALALTLATAAAGCAGARVTLTAERAAYPISLSDSVADASGRLWKRSELVKVGTFRAHHARLGFLYSGLTPASTVDVSADVNAQVAALAGEAVVGLAITSSGDCLLHDSVRPDVDQSAPAVLNAFPILPALPIWPGCVHVVLTGDIVRRPAPARAAERGQPGLRPLAPAPTTLTAKTRPLK
jgi:hypothetical protein